MTVNDLWTTALGELSLQMTRSTFDTWLAHTCLLRHDNGTVVVGVRNVYAKEWLEQRLADKVARTLEGLLGHPVAVRFEVMSAPEPKGVPRVTDADLAQGDMFFLRGVYQDVYNAIVQPGRVFAGTQYFRKKWLPLLRPTLWVTILTLRQHCFWNKATGEKRDFCKATYADLAREIGVSRSTVIRALNPEEEERKRWVDLFIPHREVLRRFSSRQGKEVNDCMLWYVQLDDPLTPEDANKLSKCQNDT